MSYPMPDEPTTPLASTPWPPPVPPVPPAAPRRRRRWLIPAILAGILAGALLGGIAWAAFGRSTPSTPAAAPTPSSSGSTRPAKSGGHGVHGTILTEAGATWTVRTAAGKTVTVTVTAQIAFGTPKQPKTAADFPVGATVVVTGSDAHGTITATRIATPAKAQSPPSPTPSSG